MKSFFKGLALLVAITCVVWIAVLWRWQVTGRQVGLGDMLLYLGLLPLVVFGLALALRWAWRSAVARQVAAAATAAAGGEAGEAGGEGAAAPADAGPAFWPLIGQWLQVPAGADAAGLLAAAAEGAPRPSPDAQLRDDEGLPVLSARMADLDVAGIEAEVAALPPAGTESRAPDPAPQVLRALACLAPLLESALYQLRSSPESFALRDPEGRAREPSRVRVLAAWPADWSEREAALAQDWLTARLTRDGMPELAPACWVLKASRASGPELMLAADKLLAAVSSQGRPDLVLVLACHSDLDDVGVQRMDRQQRLFLGSRRPKGQMLGEGAAALLLAPLTWPAPPEGEPLPLRLSRPQATRRDQSIDLPGRTTADQMRQATQAALKRAGLRNEDVTGLVSDADQHTGRAGELFAVSLDQLATLDPAEDMRLLGIVTGHIGAAGALAALAAAAAQVEAQAGPVLVLSLTDSHWRLASVLCPPAPPQEAPPAPQPAAA